MVKTLAVLKRDGWRLVYTDGSAKQLRGWWQADCGVWFGEGEDKNVGAPVPTHERQSLSRGELRDVLYALEGRRGGERMLVILDSEYMYKGITEWSVKWHRHRWWVKNREVGHRDLWEQIFPAMAGGGVAVAVGVDAFPYAGSGK